MKADGLVAADIEVRSSKYLNNLIEQDHSNIKSRTKVMLGFKRFRSAATTISGIELMHRIRKQGLSMVVIEHVMRVIMSISDRVIVLNHGQQIAAGAPHSVANDPIVIRAYLGGDFRA